MDNTAISVVVAGGVNTGKSTYIDQLVNGIFRTKHESTLFNRIATLDVNSNVGLIKFKFVDCNPHFTFAQEELLKIEKNAGCLVFGEEVNEILKIIKDFREVRPDVYFIGCVSKSDLFNVRMLNSNYWIQNGFYIDRRFEVENVPFYFLSSKKAFNMDAPLKELIRFKQNSLNKSNYESCTPLIELSA